MDGIPEEYHHPADVALPPTARRANATFVLLARNSDLNGIMMSMKQMGAPVAVTVLRVVTEATVEDRFNKKFKYPYTFLNEEPFSDEFKECVCNACL